MATIIAMLAVPSFAIADDWVATKLRGMVLRLVDGEWIQLKRGDVVSDDSVIRTLRNGRVALRRGQETVDLGGETQIQIIDKAGRQFTTVKQHFGTVGIEAEVRNVEHFAVETPFVAAVVKGTRFTVVSGKDAAKVTVKRGHVAVKDEDTNQTTLLAAGQSASSGGDGAPLDVSGRGVLPVVYAANGKPVFEDAGGPKAGTTAVSPKAAAAAAREAALADGLSKKEADKAAKAAEKSAKQAIKEAEKSASDLAYQQVIAAGGSVKAAKEAAKESAEVVKEASKEAAKESKEAAKESKEAAKEAKEEAKEAEKAGKDAAQGAVQGAVDAVGSTVSSTVETVVSLSGGGSDSDSGGKGKKD